MSKNAAMPWFSQEYIEFFKELAFNNNKEWFDLNRNRYEEYVKVPFKAFVTELLLRLRQHDQSLMPDVAQALFRINRDIRFSKDKTPYKLHCGALIGRFGRKSLEYPSYYFEFRADGVMIASGAYFPGKDFIERIRYQIIDNNDEFNEILSDEEFIKYFGSIQGLKNKVIPSVFKEAVKIQPLVANKEFYCMKDLGPEIITSPGLMDLIESYFLAGLPLNRFLQEAWES
ncbi:MAG: DUF2461 domain-containing protein [Bacteroidales bacterium]|nr:DUF2461 domain-containing protein [Bacteroidales bacterium]